MDHQCLCLGRSTLLSPKVPFPPGEVARTLRTAVKCILISNLIRLLLFLKHIHRIKFKFLLEYDKQVHCNLNPAYFLMSLPLPPKRKAFMLVVVIMLFLLSGMTFFIDSTDSQCFLRQPSSAPSRPCS